MSHRRFFCVSIASALLSFCGFTADDASAAYLGNIKRTVCATAAHEIDPQFFVEGGITGGCYIKNLNTVLTGVVHYYIPVERSSTNSTLQVGLTATLGSSPTCFFVRTFAADGSTFSSSTPVCAGGVAGTSGEFLTPAVVLPPGGSVSTQVSVGPNATIYTLKVGYVSNGT